MWNFSEKFKKNSFFFKKKGTSKKSKNDERLFEKKNYRNSENKFLGVSNKWFFCQKKKSIYLVRKNTIEKTKTNMKRGETTKEIEQKQFYNKEMNK